MTVTCVNDAPVADDETFDGAARSATPRSIVDDPTDGSRPRSPAPQKTITGDILAGDTDVDGPPGLIVVTPGTFATDDGGTVVIEADGDFTFTPAAGTSCSDPSDFFDYTVSDGNPGTPGTDTGRVTITITGCVWYVDNDDRGQRGHLDGAVRHARAGGVRLGRRPHDLRLRRRRHDHRLHGGHRPQGRPAAARRGRARCRSAPTCSTPPTRRRARRSPTPAPTSSRSTTATSCAGIEVDPQGTGGGIAGAAGDTGGGTIDDVRIVDTGTAGTQPGLELDGTAGTFDVTDLRSTTAPRPPRPADRSACASTTPARSTSPRPARSRSPRRARAASRPRARALGAGSEFDSITVTGLGQRRRVARPAPPARRRFGTTSR